MSVSPGAITAAPVADDLRPLPSTLPFTSSPYSESGVSWKRLRVSATEPVKRGSCGRSWLFMNIATSQACCSVRLRGLPSGMLAQMKPAALFSWCMPAPQLNERGPHSGGNTCRSPARWPSPSSPWQTAQFCR